MKEGLQGSKNTGLDSVFKEDRPWGPSFSLESMKPASGTQDGLSHSNDEKSDRPIITLA